MGRLVPAGALAGTNGDCQVPLSSVGTSPSSAAVAAVVAAVAAVAAVVVVVAAVVVVVVVVAAAADVVAVVVVVVAAAAAVARRTGAFAGDVACFHTQPQLQRDVALQLLQRMACRCQQSWARYWRGSAGPVSGVRGTDQGQSRGCWGRWEARPRPGGRGSGE